MDIANNILKIQSEIKRTCESCGRSPSEISILLVSKTKPNSIIKEAFKLGFDRFGENKVQEALKKYDEINNDKIKWCIIGHIQTNKVRYVARFASEIHSLDREKLAEELHKFLVKEKRSIDVLVQVNTSGETQKYGVSPEKLEELVGFVSQYDTLRIKGLMTMAIHSQNEDEVRSCFRLLKKLRDEMREVGFKNCSWDKLSMGMSGDYKVAIEEGSTEVRLGQSIFGSREIPDSHYWP